jgi:hypothetical protein
MPRRLVPRYLAALDFSKLDDGDVHEMVANIKQVAPGSPLVAGSPLIEASLAALIQRERRGCKGVPAAKYHPAPRARLT